MGVFSDFNKDKSRELWPVGWYSGTILPEYETTGSFAKVFKTEDVQTINTKTGVVSRNLKLCVGLINHLDKNSEPKKITSTYNYRVEALDPERAAYLEQIAKESKNGGPKPSGIDFRDIMALGGLEELKEAGVTLEVNGHGGYDTDKIVGTNADFYYSVRTFIDETKEKDRAVTKTELAQATGEEKWFGKITQVAKIGSKRK